MAKRPKRRKLETRPRDGMIFNVRILFEIDTLIRKRVEHKGDFTRMILDALASTDLEHVPLQRIWGSVKSRTTAGTQVIMPRPVRERLDRVAEMRSCSLNTLLNSALYWFFMQGPGSTPSSPTTGPQKEYDSISSAERAKHFGPLESLPGNVIRSSSIIPPQISHFNFDPAAGETIETAPSGELYRFYLNRYGVIQRIPRSSQEK